MSASPIAYTFPGFPLVNQLSEPTTDGRPDENASRNCVAASLSAGLIYLTKRRYYGDQLKDSVYGQGYVGMEAPGEYVKYCWEAGVTLSHYDNTNGSGLVSFIHAELHAGRPVVVTVPSNWGTPYPDPLHPSGYTHVCIAAGYGPGWVRLMNPWGGFWLDEPDAFLAKLLCYGQVWSLELRSDAMIPQGWKDDGVTLTAPNGKTVTQGFRAHVMSYPGGWAGWDWPLTESMARNPVEVGNPSLGAGTVQIFRSRQLSWTSARNVFETWTGQELLAWESAPPTDAGQVTQLEAKIKAAQAALA